MNILKEVDRLMSKKDKLWLCNINLKKLKNFQANRLRVLKSNFRIEKEGMIEDIQLYIQLKNDRSLFYQQVKELVCFIEIPKNEYKDDILYKRLENVIEITPIIQRNTRYGSNVPYSEAEKKKYTKELLEALAMWEVHTEALRDIENKY